MKSFLVLILFLNSPILLAEKEHDYAAILFFTRGKVYLSSEGGLFGEVKKGHEIAEGDIIRTKDNSLAIVRFPDKSTMRIDHNSEIEIEKVVENVEGESLGSSDIILRGGRAVIDVINKSRAPVFNVKTRSVAIGVRGTRFMAGLDPESNHMDLAVDRGEVEISHKEKPDMADAIEAGHSIHLENGSEFNQPQQHDWISKFNFNANDRDVDHSQMNKVMELKRLEHRQKRKTWVRDKIKWAKKKKRWNMFRSRHLEKVKRLKSKRMEFLKKKKFFMSKRKELVFKREKLLKERKAIFKDAKKLKAEKKKLAAAAKALRTGRGDPRKKKELEQREVRIKGRIQGLRENRESLKEQKRELLNNNFVKNYAKNEQKFQKKKKELMKKIPRKKRIKRQGKKKILEEGRKKLGLPGGLFGN
ncbi:MAG: hypothetical protein CME70_16860 [Halobacteriovorax sp.]|nr:hypothetical protein [Halobacteriovorax sp.]